MSKTHVALCGFAAAVLGFFGTVATPLCRGLPAQWQSVCLAGGDAAKLGQQHINAKLDGGQ